jgi:hypothetical protein
MFNTLSRVKRLSPQECLRFLITKGLITPARYLNFHLNLNFVHNYDVFLVQQMTLAEHSHSSRALFDSIRNTRSPTYLYQKDEQLFLGPLRTPHLLRQLPSNKGNILHCPYHTSADPHSFSFSVSKSSNPYRHTLDTAYIHFVIQSYKTRTSKSCRLRTLSYLKVYNKCFTLQSFPQGVHFIACLWMYFQGRVKQ